MKINWKEIKETASWIFCMALLFFAFKFIYAGRDTSLDVSPQIPIVGARTDMKHEVPVSGMIVETEIVPKPVVKPGLPVAKDETFSFEEKLVMKINDYRRNNGLPSWEINPILTKSSDLKAAKLNSDKVFAHYLPGHPQTEFMDEFLEAGYPSIREGNQVLFGENLACGFNTADDTLQAWKESPPHNKLLLSTKYDEAGIGFHWFVGAGLEGQDWNCLVVVLHVAGKSNVKY